MVESVAGFVLRPKIGPSRWKQIDSRRARAEELFDQAQRKEEKALSENEKEKQAEREKTARLKAIRLAKEIIEQELS